MVMCFNHNKQKGAALLSALLIMAICALLATFLLMGQRLLIRQTGWVMTSDRMDVALQGIQDWAAAVVTKNPDIRKVKDFKKDFYGIQLTGRIIALGGKFNVNLLTQTKNIPNMTVLIQRVVPDIQHNQALTLATDMSHWMLSNAHDDQYYVKSHPPYRSALQPLVDLTELRLIRGVSATIYYQLKPYLSALPSNHSKLNINYVSAPVLMSQAHLNASQAAQWISCRGNHFFISPTDFIKQCVPNAGVNTSFLTADNPYYLVKGFANQGDQHMTMTSLLKVIPENNHHSKVIIVWQEINGE
jgi:general secretion pathway protein K